MAIFDLVGARSGIRLCRDRTPFGVYPDEQGAVQETLDSMERTIAELLNVPIEMWPEWLDTRRVSPRERSVIFNCLLGESAPNPLGQSAS